MKLEHILPTWPQGRDEDRTGIGLIGSNIGSSNNQNNMSMIGGGVSRLAVSKYKPPSIVVGMTRPIPSSSVAMTTVPAVTSAAPAPAAVVPLSPASPAAVAPTTALVGARLDAAAPTGHGQGSSSFSASPAFTVLVDPIIASEKDECDVTPFLPTMAIGSSPKGPSPLAARRSRNFSNASLVVITSTPVVIAKYSSQSKQQQQ